MSDDPGILALEAVLAELGHNPLGLADVVKRAIASRRGEPDPAADVLRSLQNRYAAMACELSDERKDLDNAIAERDAAREALGQSVRECALLRSSLDMSQRDRDDAKAELAGRRLELEACAESRRAILQSFESAKLQRDEALASHGAAFSRGWRAGAAAMQSAFVEFEARSAALIVEQIEVPEPTEDK